MKLTEKKLSISIPPDAFRKFRDFHNDLAKQLGQSLAVAFRHLPGGKFPSAEEMDRAFERSITILAEHGWFTSTWHTPLAGLHHAAAGLRRGDVKRWNNALCDHFTHILDNIESDLISAFPNRGTILRKAFKAHRNEDYELSIPVMLSQADGMGTEIFGASIYSQLEDNVKRLRKFLETRIRHKSCASYCYLVATLLPINASEKKRGRYTNPMNRHLVLHGESTDYATRVNACKTVSWLQYIAGFKDSIMLTVNQSMKSGQT
jgi:hypothetical protein